MFLGGAPFNVTCHLHKLGMNSVIAGRVGNDTLGSIIKSRLKEKGISARLVQTDDKFQTGLVNVGLNAEGNAVYDIVEPAAWDFIEQNGEFMNAAGSADVIVFGSLAQRNTISRDAIMTAAGMGKINVFDVNLRPPYDNREIVESSLFKSTVVKLNDDELLKIAGWSGFDNDIKKASYALAKKFGCRVVCVTRGANGSAMLMDNTWTEHSGFKVEVKDTIGSGDAFLAAFIKGYLDKKSPPEILAEADKLGAYVATKSGADI
jgi:fructokinase